MRSDELADQTHEIFIVLLNWKSWALFALASTFVGFIYYDSLSLMLSWWQRDEYSHGYMIPIVALFLLWQKQHQVTLYVNQPSWWSTALLAIALFIYLLGELSAIYTLIQYAFIITVYALVLAFVGWRVLRVIWVALAYLIFMIPLPDFLYNTLSSQLQLISSSLGVGLIRLFDISVYLEGNVIDLGNYQLQVVEACSGLRYLFPLISFGFLVACLYKAPIWQKVLLFFSTIPITVFMNSFRIGLVGVTVEYWGIDAAQGILHDFEGWVIFVTCLFILIVEMWLFWRFRCDNSNFIDCLDLTYPDLPEVKLSTEKKSWFDNKPLVTCVTLLLFFSIYSSTLTQRQESVPLRTAFSQFPLLHQNWIGRKGFISPKVLSALKLSDYFIANYRQRSNDTAINFYMAYYASQRKGASVHSPRSCIPGGGWQIKNLSKHSLSNNSIASVEPVLVNRLIIQKNDTRQLVYYWFQQRGRLMSNGYAAKWFIFLDSLIKNRTDGALIRITTVVTDGMKISDADQKMKKFIQDFMPLLPTYIPGE